MLLPTGQPPAGVARVKTHRVSTCTGEASVPAGVQLTVLPTTAPLWVSTNVPAPVVSMPVGSPMRETIWSVPLTLNTSPLTVWFRVS